MTFIFYAGHKNNKEHEENIKSKIRSFLKIAGDEPNEKSIEEFCRNRDFSFSVKNNEIHVYVK